MPAMKFKELQTKSPKELKAMLSELRHSLGEVRFNAASNPLKNVRQMRQTKKTIAQVLFLLNQQPPAGDAQ